MKLGVQLYTVRDQLEKDFYGTLDQIAAMGLKVVEFAGLYGEDPLKVRAYLDKLGLEAPSAHIMLDRVVSDFDGVVAEAKALGYKYIVIPWVGKERYENGWTPFAQACEEAGKKLNAVGLRLLYHNHDFEFKMDGDKPGFDVLYQTASPEALGAEVDVYWVLYAGYDPVEVVKKLGTRVEILHLKDMAPTEDRHFIEGGKGVLKMPEIIEAGKASGATYGIIELDVCPNPPLESVRTSTDYYRSIGLTD